jgi:hypothetical protein
LDLSVDHGVADPGFLLDGRRSEVSNFDTNRCKKRVFPSGTYGAFNGYQCHNKPWKDGYCKVHHPETVKARQEKSMKQREAKRENDPLTRAYKKIEELENIILELRKDRVE